MSLTPPLFTSGESDGPNAALLQPSHWNAVTGLLTRLLDGVEATGSLFVKNGSINGAGWLAPVATGSFLRSAGTSALPVWSTLTLPNAAVVGDLFYASSANVVGSLPIVAAGSVLVSGASPAWSAEPLGLTSVGFSGGSLFEGSLTNIVELRNGTSAQELRVYRTRTNITNHERIEIAAGSTNYVRSGNAGTGGFRPMNLMGLTVALETGASQGAAAARWRVDTAGHFLCGADNAYDIGATGATRPRNAYIAGLLTLSGGTLLATSAALTNGAAAQNGTLTNAPTAGNPTKWIPVNDNGTTRYIPAW